MNNSKLFLIFAEDVLTTEHVGRDTDLTGWMVEMISFVGEQRFTVSLRELLRCRPIWFTWQVSRAPSGFKNTVGWGKGAWTHWIALFSQNLRIYTRESWHWKIWFASVSKLQKAWSSWLHGRYFLLKCWCKALETIKVMGERNRGMKRRKKIFAPLSDKSNHSFCTVNKCIH